MNKQELLALALPIARDTVAATEAATSLVSNICQTIATIAERTKEPDLLTVGLEGELMEMHTALGSALIARRDQIRSRLATFRLAKSLNIIGYGEDCPCAQIGGGTSGDGSQSAPLSLVA